MKVFEAWKACRRALAEGNEMRKTVEMSFFPTGIFLVFLCFETRELVVLGEWVFVFPT